MIDLVPKSITSGGGAQSSSVLSAPSPLDPSSTCLMVNIIDPAIGGIFCIDGKNALAVGDVVWSRDPAKDAGFRVFYRKSRDTLPEEIPHEDWRAFGFDLTKPHTTCGNIIGTLRGVDYQCYRAVPVIPKDATGGVIPKVTTESITGAFVGIPYTFQLEASGTAPHEWRVGSGMLPAGLTLDANTGVISGIPTAEAEGVTFVIRVLNDYGSASRTFTFSVHGTYSLDITVNKSDYIVGEVIAPQDIVVKYLGRVISYGGADGYELKYTPDILGTQTVSVWYDPHLEEVGQPATGKYDITYRQP